MFLAIALLGVAAGAPDEAAGLRAVEPRAPGAPVDVVIEGATVFTATGQVLSPGWVLVQEGRIAGVGEGVAPVPSGAQRIDAKGLFVTPGLIDSHSHLGVYPAPEALAHNDGNEMTAPVTPGVWAEHSLWPEDPGFQRALEGGVTAMQILPGSANLVGGRGVVVENVPHRGSRAMRFPGAPETVKMACGENPKRVYGERKQAPQTRMGNLRGQREAFLGAQAYARKWADYGEKLALSQKPRKGKKGGEKAPEPPERDLDQDTLVGLLEGRLLAQIHCYRADDMLSMLQVADEFGFKVRSFHHAVEAYKIRDILAKEGVSVSTWADWWGFKMESYDAIPYNIALIESSGGRPIVHSDSAIGIQRLNQEAAKALAAGRQAGIPLDEDDAVRWITANPAWALGIEGQTGTLEVGKRADVVVWDGHPLSVYASPRWVWVAGELRHDSARPRVPWSDFELGQEARP